MTEPTFTSEIPVELIDHMGGDDRVVQAARVSTVGDKTADAESAGLINYLTRDRHGSPFEHSTFQWRVTAPIFVWREHMRHRMCVTGDTVIPFCNGKSIKDRRYKSIAQVWEHWHLGVVDSKPSDRNVAVKYRKRTNDWRVSYTKRTTVDGKEAGQVVEVGVFPTEGEAREAANSHTPTYRRRMLPQCRNLHSVSIDEETGVAVPNKVITVEKSGVKMTYKVTVEDGSSVTVTSDHPFRTSLGYVSIDDGLGVGDQVQMHGVRGISDADPLVSKELRAGIGHWTTKQRAALIDGSDEADCYMCGQSFAASDLQADHVVPVVVDLSLALTFSNLKLACKSCHRTKTDLEQSHRRRGGTRVSGVRESRIVSVEASGEQMTYDIEMAAPNHNFIGNNFVLHNCSYNEQSGRYMELEPVFYVPAWDRPLVQVGKAGAYRFEEGSEYQMKFTEEEIRFSSMSAYEAYRRMLSAGVAREVARMVLPLNIMSTCVVTMNARALMNFLSLRRNVEGQQFPSFPQREIEMVAEKYEADFQRLMPHTHAAFVKHGRVAP